MAETDQSIDLERDLGVAEYGADKIKALEGLEAVR